MNNSSSLTLKVDEMIGFLSKNLSNEDIQAGWTGESQEAMLEFFKTLKKDITNGDEFLSKLEYQTIIRGLDSWGILQGRLFRLSSDISAEIINQSE